MISKKNGIEYMVCILELLLTTEYFDNIKITKEEKLMNLIYLMNI